MTRLTDERICEIEADYHWGIEGSLNTLASARAMIGVLLADRAALVAEVGWMAAELESIRGVAIRDFLADCREREATIVQLQAEVARLRAANEALSAACREARGEILGRIVEAEKRYDGNAAARVSLVLRALDAALAAHAAGAAGGEAIRD